MAQNNAPSVGSFNAFLSGFRSTNGQPYSLSIDKNPGVTITRTLGLAPNFIRVEVPVAPSTPSDIGIGDECSITLVGMLNAISFPCLTIHQVEYIEGREGTTLAITLKDRRWRLIGTSAITGRYNLPRGGATFDVDGNAISGTLDNRESPLNLKELVQLLFEAMGCVADDGESHPASYYLDNLVINLDQMTADAQAIFPPVVWEWANPAQEAERLLAEYGYSVSLWCAKPDLPPAIPRAAGVEPPGLRARGGELPDPPYNRLVVIKMGELHPQQAGGFYSPSSERATDVQTAPTIPTRTVVVGDRTIIEQTTALVPYGLDLDGRWKPLELVSYVRHIMKADQPDVPDVDNFPYGEFHRLGTPGDSGLYFEADRPALGGEGEATTLKGNVRLPCVEYTGPKAGTYDGSDWKLPDGGWPSPTDPACSRHATIDQVRAAASRSVWRAYGLPANERWKLPMVRTIAMTRELGMSSARRRDPRVHVSRFDPHFIAATPGRTSVGGNRPSEEAKAGFTIDYANGVVLFDTATYLMGSAAWSGVVEIKQSNDQAQVRLPLVDHGFADGDTVTVSWSGGYSRSNCAVNVEPGSAVISLSGGSGTAFPVAGTSVDIERSGPFSASGTMHRDGYTLHIDLDDVAWAESGMTVNVSWDGGERTGMTIASVVTGGEHIGIDVSGGDGDELPADGVGVSILVATGAVAAGFIQPAQVLFTWAHASLGYQPITPVEDPDDWPPVFAEVPIKPELEEEPPPGQPTPPENPFAWYGQLTRFDFYQYPLLMDDQLVEAEIIRRPELRLFKQATVPLNQAELDAEATKCIAHRRANFGGTLDAPELQSPILLSASCDGLLRQLTWSVTASGETTVCTANRERGSGAQYRSWQDRLWGGSVTGAVSNAKHSRLSHPDHAPAAEPAGASAVVFHSAIDSDRQTTLPSTVVAFNASKQPIQAGSPARVLGVDPTDGRFLQISVGESTTTMARGGTAGVPELYMVADSDFTVDGIGRVAHAGIVVCRVATEVAAGDGLRPGTGAGEDKSLWYSGPDHVVIQKIGDHLALVRLGNTGSLPRLAVIVGWQSIEAGYRLATCQIKTGMPYAFEFGESVIAYAGKNPKLVTGSEVLVQRITPMVDYPSVTYAVICLADRVDPAALVAPIDQCIVTMGNTCQVL